MKLLGIFFPLLLVSVNLFACQLDSQKNPIIEWRGKNYTNYDPQKLSLYLGDTSLFIQIPKNDFAKKFPVLKEAIETNKKWVRIFYLSPDIIRKDLLMQGYDDSNDFEFMIKELQSDFTNSKMRTNVRCFNLIINELRAERTLPISDTNKIALEKIEYKNCADKDYPFYLFAAAESSKPSFSTVQPKRYAIKISKECAPYIPAFKEKKSDQIIQEFSNLPPELTLLEPIRTCIFLYSVGAFRQLNNVVENKQEEDKKQIIPILKRLFQEFPVQLKLPDKSFYEAKPSVSIRIRFENILKNIKNNKTLSVSLFCLLGYIGYKILQKN